MSSGPPTRGRWRRQRAALVAIACALALARASAQDLETIPTDSLPTSLQGDPPAAVWGNDSRGRQDPSMKVRLAPSSARIGQALTYRGSVMVEKGDKVKFVPPKSGGAFTWSRIRAGRVTPTWWRSTRNQLDSVWFEARLQVFEVGRIAVEGPVVQMRVMKDRRWQPGEVRLPTVNVTILPTVLPADSNARMRALHGPLKAPWWERIGWLPIAIGLALLAAIVLAIRRLRRKKPRPVAAPAAVPAPARARLDPAAEALRALAALRARGLPQAGRFGEHAFELTAILRRFLEVTVTTPRPGDTSGELLERLRSARMPEDDYGRLEGLLTLWDRVKFARAPLTEAEAARCEEAVEGFVRRVAAARAAAARPATAPAAPGAPRAPGPPPAPEAA